MQSKDARKKNPPKNEKKKNCVCVCVCERERERERERSHFLWGKLCIE